MENSKSIILGIDFGTTNTVITYFINNKVNILLDGIFKYIPSKIGKYNGRLYCGNYIPLNCQSIIHSFKLNIDSTQRISFNDEQTYSYYDLLIIFFKHLYELIKKNLKLATDTCFKVVITVPSNFNDRQREIIKSAFEHVNFQVIRIINEPSAAALAYGLRDLTNPEAKILVIDTGGGTMDFTILEKSEYFFEVLHSEGLNDLGGNDFTEIIYNDIIKTNKINVNPDNKNILWNQAQKIKEKLTYLDYYEIKEYNLTKKKFINLANDLIKKIENTLQEIIKNNNFDYIILVGGTSKIAFLQDAIEKITNIKPWIHPNLESVVAEGACLYTAILEGQYTANNDVILIDILPLSLGIELADGTFSIVIPKNTPLPVKRVQKYTTDSPNNTCVNIKVYQGERKIANKNFLIGEFMFDKVSTNTISPIIEIAFKVDLNSIINITVIDKKSGIEKNIIIKDIPQIDFTKIEELITSANELVDIDENELAIIKNKYLIKTYIENSIINLQVNELIDNTEKGNIIKNLNNIEENLDNMNNLQLIEVLNNLQEKFSILGSLNLENKNDYKTDDVEKLFLYDRKQELYNKVNILLVKNSSWSDYLKPILEELTYDNISINYINEKLELLNQLENENDTKDFKQEVENLCLYIKSEIENGSINIGDKNIILIKLINETINMIDENNKETNWEEQLNFLNKKCEELYYEKN